MSNNYSSDWSFKDPDKPNIPYMPKQKKEAIKKSKKQNRAKAKRKKLLNCRDDFYLSDEWRKLRYRVLKKYNATCMCCGADRSDGVKIHVDHIKPRSKWPHLALDFTNLQVLCEDCNIGKSNIDSTDWRPISEVKDFDEILDEETLIAARQFV